MGVRVLFVCLGNICRSPCAEGVLKHQGSKLPVELEVASCGLGDWHSGQLPDERMRKTAELRGISLVSRAQAFKPDFFNHYDLILAADNKVISQLQQWAKKPEDKAKIHLITKFSKAYLNQEIPDPYYGNQGHFELVMDMIEDSCQGLINHLVLNIPK